MLLGTKSEALPAFAGACGSKIYFKEWVIARRNGYAEEVLECGEQGHSVCICGNKCNELKQAEGTTNYSSRKAQSKRLENLWSNRVGSC